MKPFLSWLTIYITSVGFGEVCSRSHWQFYLELIKLTRTLGLMQHAANSRVNCKTVRADEGGVSMSRNAILRIDTNHEVLEVKGLGETGKGTGKCGLVDTAKTLLLFLSLFRGIQRKF